MNRQTIKAIREAHQISLEQLAKAANVEMRVAYVAGIGGQISAGEAEKLLKALSEITGKRFTRTDVKLKVMNPLQERVLSDPLPQPLKRQQFSLKSGQLPQQKGSATSV